MTPRVTKLVLAISAPVLALLAAFLITSLVLLAAGDPVLLVASHPTRGVDVGAQAAIWEHIREARRQGLAVLLISADLDELIGLSDSIKVILRGRFVGDFDPMRVTPQELGSAMTGAAADPEPSDEPAESPAAKEGE